MSSTTAGILFLVSLVVALAAVHVPLGDYMYRVYTRAEDSRIERGIYRLIGADPKAEQTWGAYARSVLAFSAVSILFLFIFPGVMALSLYPDLESPDQVFPTLVFDLMPVGVRGLILAAVIAATTLGGSRPTAPQEHLSNDARREAGTHTR